MRDRIQGSLVKIPFMLKVFLFLLLILLPILTFISLCIDFSFIIEGNSRFSFNTAVLSRALIKTAIALYGILVARPFVRKTKVTYFSIKIYLFIALFSPWGAEVPFLLLNIYSETPFLIIKEVWVNFILSTVFFVTWFSYFTFSKKIKKYIKI